MSRQRDGALGPAVGQHPQPVTLGVSLGQREVLDPAAVLQAVQRFGDLRLGGKAKDASSFTMGAAPETSIARYETADFPISLTLCHCARNESRQRLSPLTPLGLQG